MQKEITKTTEKGSESKKNVPNRNIEQSRVCVCVCVVTLVCVCVLTLVCVCVRERECER